MVYLNRIYTRGGDQGETSLGDGSRVHKTHPRIVAFGTIDELNAALGLVMCCDLPESIAVGLKRVQNDLFDLGADLCVPERVASPETAEATPADEPAYTPLRATAAQVTRLEEWIDQLNESLQPLSSFILPGGTPASAQLHQARTICRRAEIEVLRLAEVEQVNPQVVIYLNRLSDLLFVLCRICNDNGKNDVLWIPGGER